MSFVDLRAIEARLKAVTKGPWQVEGEYPQQVLANDDGLVLIATTHTGPEHPPVVADLIAHAPTDLRNLIDRVRELEALNIDAATQAMLARLGEQNERNAADRWRAHAKVEYDLRGWLRLCEDNPAGHTEFYQWACHLYFGQPAPGDEEDEDEDDE